MNTEEILYICTSCGIKENIPKEVVEYFDEMDQSNINEPPCFSCEKCGGIMMVLCQYFGHKKSNFFMLHF